MLHLPLLAAENQATKDVAICAAALFLVADLTPQIFLHDR
jgi:hypothetical protein